MDHAQQQMARDAIIESIMEALREQRLVAVVLDGFPDRIAINEAIDSAGVLTFTADDGRIYKVTHSALKAAVFLQEEPPRPNTFKAGTTPNYHR